MKCNLTQTFWFARQRPKFCGECMKGVLSQVLCVMGIQLTKGGVIRDWSLITGRGGYKTGGGAREVLPLRKGGAEKVLAILKGGHKQFWGCFTR